MIYHSVVWPQISRAFLSKIPGLPSLASGTSFRPLYRGKFVRKIQTPEAPQGPCFFEDYWNEFAGEMEFEQVRNYIKYWVFNDLVNITQKRAISQS